MKYNVPDIIYIHLYDLHTHLTFKYPPEGKLFPLTFEQKVQTFLVYEGKKVSS